MSEKISKPLSYWQEFFKNAHKESCEPYTAGISFEIFERDEVSIMMAAKQNRYEIYFKTRSSVGFMRQQ